MIINKKIKDHTRLAIHYWCVVIIQWYPILCTVLFWVHVVLLLCGIETPFAEMLGGCSLFLFCILLAASYAYDFCYLHRVFLIYNYAVSVCIDYENWLGFGKLLFPARLTMAVIGFVLLIVFLIYRKEICDEWKG